MAKRVELWEGKGGRWFFHGVAENGRIVASSTESDGYPDESHCREGVQAQMTFWTDGTPLETVVVKASDAAASEKAAKPKKAAAHPKKK